MLQFSNFDIPPFKAAQTPLVRMKHQPATLTTLIKVSKTTHFSAIPKCIRYCYQSTYMPSKHQSNIAKPINLIVRPIKTTCPSRKQHVVLI